MNIGLWSAAVAIVAAIIRFAIGVRGGDDESDRNLIGSVVLTALAASVIGFGVATIPYPFLHENFEGFTKTFYKDWVTDPIFICIAGLTFALCGFQGVRAELRTSRARRAKPGKPAGPPPDSGESVT